MFEAITIGTSAGGMAALRTILADLPNDFSVPIAIVQHLADQTESYLCEYLDQECRLIVKEAEDKEPLLPGHAYLAVPGYHLLIEPDKTFSLSVDEKVQHCRPAIDPLFESASDTFGAALIGVVLTGANADGAAGLKTIKDRGGITIVQHPDTAEARYMPQAAILGSPIDYILELEQISGLLMHLCQGGTHGTRAEH